MLNELTRLTRVVCFVENRPAVNLGFKADMMFDFDSSRLEYVIAVTVGISFICKPNERFPGLKLREDYSRRNAKPYVVG